jgi:hypothetical protein
MRGTIAGLFQDSGTLSLPRRAGDRSICRKSLMTGFIFLLLGHFFKCIFRCIADRTGPIVGKLFKGDPFFGLVIFIATDCASPHILIPPHFYFKNIIAGLL